MIGSGELFEGLYFLTTQDTPSATIASSQVQPQPTFLPQEALWHF